MTDDYTFARTPDRGYALGRCHEKHGCGIAWAWRKGDLRIEDVKCFGCGNGLHQTTRLLKRGFRVLGDAAVLQQIARAQVDTARVLYHDRQMLQAWINDGCKTAVAREYGIAQWQRAIASSEAREARLNSAYRRVTKRLARTREEVAA